MFFLNTGMFDRQYICSHCGGRVFQQTVGIPMGTNYAPLYLDMGGKGKVLITLYDKRDDFHSVLSTFLSSVGKSVQHLRMEFSCQNSYVMSELAGNTCRLLTIRLVGEGFFVTRLKLSLLKFYGRHHELADRYIEFICTMRTDLFNVS